MRDQGSIRISIHSQSAHRARVTLSVPSIYQHTGLHGFLFMSTVLFKVAYSDQSNIVVMVKEATSKQGWKQPKLLQCTTCYQDFCELRPHDKHLTKEEMTIVIRQRTVCPNSRPSVPEMSTFDPLRDQTGRTETPRRDEIINLRYWNPHAPIFSTRPKE